MNTETRVCQRLGCQNPLPPNSRSNRQFCSSACRSSSAKRGQVRDRRALRAENKALREAIADLQARLATNG